MVLLHESQALDARPSVAFFPLFPHSGPFCLTLKISQAGDSGQHHCCLAVSLTSSGLKQLGLFCFDFQSSGRVFIFLSKWETLLCMRAPSKSVFLKQTSQKIQLNLEPIQIPEGVCQGPLKSVCEIRRQNCACFLQWRSIQ